MSGEFGEGTFLDIFKPDPAELADICVGAPGVDHMVGLLFEPGVVVTPEDAQHCREAAAEDIVMLLGCPVEKAVEIVGYMEDQKSWERAING